MSGTSRCGHSRVQPPADRQGRADALRRRRLEPLVETTRAHTRQGSASSTSWIEQLATLESGVAYIYSLLDRAAEDWHLDDAILVLRERSAGRQAFRLGGRPPSDGWSVTTAVHAPEGLHTRPPLPTQHLGREVVVALCRAAFRVDVLLHRSLTDPLTGLHDRASLADQIESAVERGERYAQRFSLVLIDLDGFKEINDRLGHTAGDMILRDFARSLRGVVRGSDVAARIGGDEFAVLVADADPSEAEAVASRTRSALEDRGVPVGFSYGVATYPQDGREASDLFAAADTRLYEAKTDPR